MLSNLNLKPGTLFSSLRAITLVDEFVLSTTPPGHIAVLFSDFRLRHMHLSWNAAWNVNLFSTAKFVVETPGIAHGIFL